MLVSERLKQPYWFFLYSHFLRQTDTAKMMAGLDELEYAILERLQELDGMPESQSERLAIEVACQKLLEIKTSKLGFPPIDVGGPTAPPAASLR